MLPTAAISRSRVDLARLIFSSPTHRLHWRPARMGRTAPRCLGECRAGIEVPIAISFGVRDYAAEIVVAVTHAVRRSEPLVAERPHAEREAGYMHRSSFFAIPANSSTHLAASSNPSSPPARLAIARHRSPTSGAMSWARA